MKDAAASQLTLDPDATAHQCDQPPHDREPESAAAVLAGGRRVGLGETGENVFEFVRGDSDAGIRDREMQMTGIVGIALVLDGEHDLASLGKLDRVANQIQHDLAHAQPIADERSRNARHHMRQQLEALLMGANAEGFDRSIDQAFEVEGGMFERQAAAFDSCEVRIPLIRSSSASPLLVMISRYLCWSGSSLVSSSNCAMPKIAFIGVRISCDMLDRNSDLARDASSADSRAAISSRPVSRNSAVRTATSFSISALTVSSRARSTAIALISLRLCTIEMIRKKSSNTTHPICSAHRHGCTAVTPYIDSGK